MQKNIKFTRTLKTVDISFSERETTTVSTRKSRVLNLDI